MDAKEKAKELVDKFNSVYPHKGMNKNAAIIAVDEIIYGITESQNVPEWVYKDALWYSYWHIVKKEIELL